MKKLIAAVAFLLGFIIGYVVGEDAWVSRPSYQWHAHTFPQPAQEEKENDELDGDDSPAA